MFLKFTTVPLYIYMKKRENYGILLASTQLLRICVNASLWYSRWKKLATEANQSSLFSSGLRSAPLVYILSIFCYFCIKLRIFFSLFLLPWYVSLSEKAHLLQMTCINAGLELALIAVRYVVLSITSVPLSTWLVTAKCTCAETAWMIYKYLCT